MARTPVLPEATPVGSLSARSRSCRSAAPDASGTPAAGANLRL